MSRSVAVSAPIPLTFAAATPGHIVAAQIDCALCGTAWDPKCPNASQADRSAP